MNNVAKIFIAQYFMVMLLGLQTINVSHFNIWNAVFVSIALGVCGFTVTSIIANVNKLRSLEGLAFVCAGPLGIVTSIWISGGLNA